MTPRSASRVDLHCHPTASAVCGLGVQRGRGRPERATPPQEVYDLAESRGKDLVTITDHGTIDGALGEGHVRAVVSADALHAATRAA